MTIESLIDAVLDREGGYTNHPADRGGETNHGITAAVARANGYAGTMRDLPLDTALTIYRKLYWLAPRFEGLETDVETRRGRQLERGDIVSGAAKSARVGGEREWE